MPASTQARRLSLADRLAGWRNRLVASARFQRRAAALPFLRGQARRDGERIFDILAGFVQAQVLLACVELGLLEQLRAGPMDPADMARDTGIPVARMEDLCRAAVALGLMETSVSGFRLGRLGAALPAVPGLVPMIRHNALFYRDLADPVALLRGAAETELARFWPYVMGQAGDIPPETAAAYSELMAASQVLVADETLRLAPFGRVRCVMDVGGGTGAFLCAAGARHPHLRLRLFDLPPVAAQAHARFAQAGLSARAEVVGGSFRDNLPEGADAISLVRVLYDHDDVTVRALLARAHEALPPGGLLIVSEPMSGGARPTRAGDGYFAFYTMAMGTGQVRSAERIGALLAEAGFISIRSMPGGRPFITSVVLARRAG